MQRLLVLAVSAALGLLAIVVSAPTLAQTAPGTLEACRGTQARVQASALPEVVAPGRCPLEGGVIVDNGVGTVVPEPGQAIYAEAMTTSGAQELTVTRSEDGTIALDSVGDDTTAQAEAAMDAAVPSAARELATARIGNGCSDSAFVNNNWRVAKFMRYAINVRSIPSELRKRSAVFAIRKGGRNIYNTRNSCGFRDRVPARLIYTGNTRSSANINTNASCSPQNGKSVIGFGTLPRNYTSFYCMVTGVRPGPDRPIANDVRLNKASKTWTTNPRGRCRGRWDVESTVTHERGHTFGLAHVSERRHGSLTMSPDSEGACQTSERTLGRGDVLGLARKY